MIGIPQPTQGGSIPLRANTNRLLKRRSGPKTKKKKHILVDACPVLPPLQYTHWLPCKLLVGSSSSLTPRSMRQLCPALLVPCHFLCFFPSIRDSGRCCCSCEFRQRLAKKKKLEAGHHQPDPTSPRKTGSSRVSDPTQNVLTTVWQPTQCALLFMAGIVAQAFPVWVPPSFHSTLAFTVHL